MSDFKLAAELEITGVRADKALNALRTQLKNVGNVKIGIDSSAVPVAAQNIDSFQKKVDGVTTSVDRLGTTSRKTDGDIGRTTTSIKRAASAAEDFGDKAGLALRRFTAFSVAAGATFGTFFAIRRQLAGAINFERDLVKVAQVTQSSLKSLEGLRKEIGALSVAFGQPASEIANVAQTLAQAGLSARDTEIALRSITQTSLAATFTDINNTTEGAVAAMSQFGLEAKDLGRSLDIINAVAGQFAVESDDIITAIQKAGAVFASSSKGVSQGNDALAEFAATFTSIRSTTRESADTIATGLRTIFSRLQRPDTIEFLRQFNVELTDLEGKFVGPYEALQRLGEGLKGLDTRDLRFAQIVEVLGGIRQVSKVLPAIQQTALANQALNVAFQSQGSVAREVGIAQETLAVQIDKTRENFAELFREIADTESFKELVKGLLSITNAMIDVAKTAKEVIPILGALGLAKAAVFSVRSLPSFSNRARTGLPGFQSGGRVPGIGYGDKVPILAEPGEFILNRNAVKKIGVANLHKVNSSVPRFQTGGFIGKFQNGGLIPGFITGDEISSKVGKDFAENIAKAVNSIFGENAKVLMDEVTKGFRLQLGSGKKFVDISLDPALTDLSTRSPEQLARAAADYGVPVHQIKNAKSRGVYRTQDNVIGLNPSLLDTPEKVERTLRHEAFHFAYRQGLLSKKQVQKLEKLAVNPNDPRTKEEQIAGFLSKTKSELGNNDVLGFIGEPNRERAAKDRSRRINKAAEEAEGRSRRRNEPFGNLTGKGRSFLRNEEFRRGIELSAKELQAIGYSAGQVNSIFSELANKARGPGEAIERILVKTQRELDIYNKTLVDRTRRANKARITAPLLNTVPLPPVEDQVLNILNSRTPLDLTKRRDHVRRQLLKTPKGGGNATDVRRQVLKQLKDQAIVNTGRLGSGLDIEGAGDILNSSGSLGPVSPADRRRRFNADNRSEFFKQLGLPTNATREQRRARIKQLQRQARLKNGLLKRGGLGAAGLAGVAAAGALGSGFDQDSSFGAGATAGLTTLFAGSQLGLGAAAFPAAILAGIDASAKQSSQNRLSSKADGLDKATDFLTDTMTRLANQFDGAANLKIKDSVQKFIKAQDDFVKQQRAEDSGSNTSLSAFLAGSSSLISNGEVNANLRTARGTGSFFGSRLQSANLTLGNILTFGTEREFFQKKQNEIILEDTRKEQELELSRERERATRAAPIAEASEKRIRELISTGRKDLITRDLLLGASQDEVLPGATDSARILQEQAKWAAYANSELGKLGERFRSLADKALALSVALEAQSYQLDNVVSDISNNSQKITALATGRQTDFGSVNKLEFFGALSKEEQNSTIRNLARSSGGDQINQLLFDKAASLPGLSKEIRELEGLGDIISEPQKARLNNLNVEFDSAKESLEFLSRFQEAVNKATQAIEEESGVRNNLIQQADNLRLSLINRISSANQQREDLFGGPEPRIFRQDSAGIQARALVGTADPARIAANIRNIQRDRRLNQESTGTSQQQKARIEGNLVSSLERNRQALEILSSDISELSQIQSELSRIQQQREGGRNFLTGAFGRSPEENLARIRQARAFQSFQASGGDLQSVIRGGIRQGQVISPDDILQGFQQRQESLQLFDPKRAEQEAAEFAQNILRSFGVQNFGQLEQKIGPEAAARLRPALEAQGQGQKERQLLKEFDAITIRQLESIQTQKNLIDQTITNFNNNILANMQLNILNLEKVARELNKEITVTFKPVEVNVNLNGAAMFHVLEPKIQEFIADGVNKALKREREGQQ